MISVAEARRSRSRPALGIAKLRTKGFNQDGAAVIGFFRTIMVYRRGHAPEGFKPHAFNDKRRGGRAV
jgi:hypothetical protein